MKTRLLELLDNMGTDEIKVMLYLAERLHAGAKKYGAINLSTDSRDWQEEIRQEVADAIMYSVFRDLQEAGKR